MALTLATISTTAIAQDCGVAPAPPATPDGLEATEEEMIAAVGEFKSYQAANKEFMDCHLKNCPNLAADDIEALDEESTALRQISCSAHDSAVDAEQNAGAFLNAQIKAFKSKP